MTSPKIKISGHCGRIFREYDNCEEPKIDDLCQGCPFNDEEQEEYDGEEYGN
jgi:hypothetical protein